MSVPLRQSLVMSVMMGDNYSLPSDLFSSEVVNKLVSVVTGICPEQIFFSGMTEILLVFSSSTDVLNISSQLNHLIVWMGKKVQVHCHKPSGSELQKCGVMGTIGVIPKSKDSPNRSYDTGSQALHIPFFSASNCPQEDEVPLSVWLYHVKQAQDYCPIEVVKDWIYRSLRGEALQTVISMGEGLSVDQILSRLDLKYGSVLSFDELMKAYLNVAQKPQELVTDYIVRLERAQSQLQAEYPEKVDPTNRTSHLREIFYQGLRR